MQGERIYLRLLEIHDTEAMLDLQSRNREFFQQYAPTRDDDFYTLNAQFELIKKSFYKKEADQTYSFGIFLTETSCLIGNITLAHILRGPLQSCILGYYLDQLHNGKGLMSEAVDLIIHFAFNELKLHRIEAGVMPSNIGSARVLEKAGFQREGIAKKNIEINGKWEDHQVFAIIADDTEESKAI